MAHEFTSGTFADTAAWHTLGNVETNTANITPEYFFADANALFPVEPLELWGGNPANPERMIPFKKKAQGIWRPDTQHILGTTCPGYEVIPNQLLLDFAKKIESEATIDAVIVLRMGAKVAFTAKLRDLEGVVVPGDNVKRYVVGYLGHDGLTGFGGMFSNTRVVCNNTLQGALYRDGREGSGQFSIAHNAFEIAQIDKVLEQIDFARQSFPETISLYQMMQQVRCTDEEFRQFLNDAYKPKPVESIEGEVRAGDVLRDMPRKADDLMAAWQHGVGMDIPGVAGTAWAAFNAVTQVEGRIPPDAANNKRRFHSAYFGGGRTVIRRAEQAARALIGV
jgi:phage/plasmid-like protein (TIGR03299 family)